MRTVLVIGASGGIGNKTTEMLLSEGYEVIGTYYQHADKLNNLKSNSNFIPQQVDLKSPDSIKKLKQLVGKELYAVINCGGIVKFENGDLKNDFTVWDETTAVNLSGNYYLAKIFQDLFLPGGRLVMISSTDAIYGGPITAAYSASKTGINSLTKSLSLALKEKKILVNSVAPGWVLTPMIEGNGEKFLNKVAAINPLKRNAVPEDITKVISFLLSDKANYLNGQVITLDGGYTNQDPTLLLEQDSKTS